MITFKVIKESELYRNYFASQKEKELFLELACDFADKYFRLDIKLYLAETLGCSLNAAERENFKNQIKVKCDENGMWVFKKNSQMHKKWQEEVVSKINFENFERNKFWYLPYFSYKVSYNLWHYDDEIYGLLEGSNITLPRDCEEIKQSEYYSIIEEMEGLAE